MRTRDIVAILLLAVIPVWTLPGCWGSEYLGIEGSWQGELKGQRIAVEFQPAKEVIILDGRPGAMRVKAKEGDSISLELTGPDGRSGEAVITVLGENRIQLAIPRSDIRVELKKAA